MTRAALDGNFDSPATAALAADAAALPASAADKLIDVAWTSRLFCLLCTGVGCYFAAVSLVALRAGDAASAWLLPLATGSLTALLCAGVAVIRAPAVLSRRGVGLRSLAIALLVLYAFVLLPALGFLLGSLLLVATVASVYATRPIVVALGGTVIAVALWALFAYVIAEPLPSGWVWG